MQYFRFCLVILAICAAACAPQTKLLHITYYAEAPLTDAQIAPFEEQIDAAAFTAAILVGLNPDRVFDGQRAFIVGFHDGPIEYKGDLYAGLTSEPVVRVMFTPRCLFDPRSALLHEFVHKMLGFVNPLGDMDGQHTNARWQLVPHLNAALAEHYCAGVFPPFMPAPTAGVQSIRQ